MWARHHCPLLCACSEQIANHNEMGWSMGESQNHGCIIRPVYQTCKMAVRQCFSSGHTRYYSTKKIKITCCPKSIFLRDRNTKNPPKKQNACEIAGKWPLIKITFLEQLFLLYTFHRHGHLIVLKNFLRPENRQTFSRLFLLPA